MRIPQPKKRSRALVLSVGFTVSALVGLMVGVQIGARAAQTPPKRFRPASVAATPHASARATLAPHPTILAARPTAAPTAPAQVTTVSPAPLRLAPGSVRARIAAAWPGDDAWADRVTGCETGRTWDPRAVNPNGHYGLWQFDLGTWREVGGAGNPIDASVEEQTARAWRLFSKPDGGPGRWECRG